METRKVWLWAGLPKSSFWVTAGKLSEGCDKADAGAERCRGRGSGAGREGLKGCSSRASRMGKQTMGLLEHAKAHIPDAPCERCLHLSAGSDWQPQGALMSCARPSTMATRIDV
jgi:hypothetical protein